MKRTKGAKRTVGPRALSGSAQAKRLAVVVLEVLSGLRDARDGGRAMGVSLNRYYQLETRALQGLIASLEPRPKGRQRTAEEKLATLERAKQRLEQELGRHQALVRAAQRSIGIPSIASDGKGSKLRGKKQAREGKRRRRTVARGLKAIAVLREGAKVADKPDGQKASSPPAVSASP
jgi:hypothetical protein